MSLWSVALTSSVGSLRRRMPTLSFTEHSITWAFLTKIIAGRMKKTDVAHKASNRHVSIVSRSHSEPGVCPIRCVDRTFQSHSLPKSLSWPLPVTWKLCDENTPERMSSHSSKDFILVTKLILFCNYFIKYRAFSGHGWEKEEGHKSGVTISTGHCTTTPN